MRLSLDIAQGMAFLHDNEIIHRYKFKFSQSVISCKNDSMHYFSSSVLNACKKDRSEISLLIFNDVNLIFSYICLILNKFTCMWYGFTTVFLLNF